jgi:hypothetical protein
MGDDVPLTILCIRHAEKPTEDGPAGIDASGHRDEHSLTPRGWQRAGAWVQLFLPALGGSPRLPTPTAIFASDPGDGGDRSRRPFQTVQAMAAAIPLDVDRRFAKGEEGRLATAVQAMTGVVLVCWQHESIGSIVQALDNPPRDVPAHWPGHCFNAVYCLSRNRPDWTFELLMPQLLDGDSSLPFD